MKTRHSTLLSDVYFCRPASDLVRDFKSFSNTLSSGLVSYLEIDSYVLARQQTDTCCVYHIPYSVRPFTRMAKNVEVSFFIPLRNGWRYSLQSMIDQIEPFAKQLLGLCRTAIGNVPYLYITQPAFGQRSASCAFHYGNLAVPNRVTGVPLTSRLTAHINCYR